MKKKRNILYSTVYLKGIPSLIWNKNLEFEGGLNSEQLTLCLAFLLSMGNLGRMVSPPIRLWNSGIPKFSFGILKYPSAFYAKWNGSSIPRIYSFRSQGHMREWGQINDVGSYSWSLKSEIFFKFWVSTLQFEDCHSGGSQEKWAISFQVSFPKTILDVIWIRNSCTNLAEEKKKKSKREKDCWIHGKAVWIPNLLLGRDPLPCNTLPLQFKTRLFAPRPG